jgi:hypothetical protein
MLKKVVFGKATYGSGDVFIRISNSVPNLITIAYFRSFFLIITSIMVTNFRNYEPS